MFKELFTEGLKSTILDFKNFKSEVERAGFDVMTVSLNTIVFKKDGKKGQVWANGDSLKWVVDKGSFKPNEIRAVKSAVKSNITTKAEALADVRMTEAAPVLDKEAKKILKWVDEILGDLTEAIKRVQGIKQGTFKEILGYELSQFKSIKKFYELDNKIAIDGVHNDGSKVIKQIPFPTNDYQHKKDVLKALNVRMIPKINKGK